MEKFSFKRFWNVFHCEYSKLRLVFVGILVATIAVMLICSSLLMFPNWIGRSFKSFVFYMLAGVDLFMYVGVLVTSAMFAATGYNKTLIPELLQPASNAEKFWAKFVVCWVIPTLFAFAIIWLAPQYFEHFETQDDNGEIIRMARVNGKMLLKESEMPSRWEMYRLHFCLYLCMSGLMMLISSIYYQYADPSKFGVFVGVATFVVLMLKNFVDVDYFCSGSFYDCITANSCRVTIFQLVLGFSIVAICTAIAYRRFCRLTLKS